MTMLAQDVYGRTVDMITSGGCDIYLVGEAIPFSFPTGTPTATAYVAFARQGKLKQFQDSLHEFGQSRYDTLTQINFIAMYLAAQANSLTNRQAYIGRILTWLNSVLNYSASFAASVNSSVDPNAIASLQWDFSTLSSSDPQITLGGAVIINT